MPVGIGVVRQGAAYGRVLRDNGDRTFGPGDVGQSGMTVFADRNGNGSPDAGEPTAVTDANGNYVLPGLGTGTFTIRIVPRPGFGLISTGTRTAVLTAGSPTSIGNEVAAAPRALIADQPTTVGPMARVRTQRSAR